MTISLILLFAFFLRLINLSQSIWLDEAVQAITAKNSLTYIFQEIIGDFHPPLYHFLMHFWVNILGDSEIALRIPSVLFGTATVYLVYKICNLGNLKHLKYLGAILLATAPFHIYYSQEARMYSMATFLATTSFYFFLKISKNNDYSFKKKSYILYFIFSTLAVYTDYYAWLAILAQAIFLIFRKKFKFLILNSMFLILCYIPWVPMFINQIKNGMLVSSILPEWAKLVNLSVLKALPLTFIKFTIGRITIFDKTIYAFVGGCIIILCGFLIVKGYFKGKKLLIINYQLLITLWFFVPLIISWLASLFVPNFQPFRLLLILPAFYLLIAFGISQIHASMIYIIVLIMVGINLISTGVYYFNPYFQREDWRGLTTYLLKQKNVAVILPSSTSNWPIKYYDKEGKIKLTEGVVGVGEIRDIGEIKGLGEKNFYYIRYLVSVFDPEEKILESLREEGYTKTTEMSFNQISVWEYRLKD